MSAVAHAPLHSTTSPRYIVSGTAASNSDANSGLQLNTNASGLNTGIQAATQPSGQPISLGTTSHMQQQQQQPNLNRQNIHNTPLGGGNMSSVPPLGGSQAPTTQQLGGGFSPQFIGSQLGTQNYGIPPLGSGLGGAPLGTGAGVAAAGRGSSNIIGSAAPSTDVESLVGSLRSILNGLNANSGSPATSSNIDFSMSSRISELTNSSFGDDLNGPEISQITSLGQHIQQLANSVRSKAIELERVYVGDDVEGFDSTTTYSYGAGSPNPQLMNAEARRKWRSREFASSNLLSGPSYLDHVPGAQYCVDAGLHHHHKLNVRKRQKKYPPWNSRWFYELELHLRDIASKLSNAFSFFQQITSSQRSKFLKTLSDLISQIMQSLANSGTGSSAEIAALKAKIAHLENLLRTRPNVPYNLTYTNDAEVAELRRQIEARDRRIAELEALLKQRPTAPNSIYVDVKQADPRVEEHRVRAVQGASCLWASGAVNQTAVGLPSNPPADIIIEPPDVKAIDAQGKTLDMQVVYRRQ